MDDLRSQGCNLLIRSRTANPITSVEDFLKELGMSRRSTKATAESDGQRLQRLYSGTAAQDRIETMGRLLLAIRSEKGITIEDLACRTGLDYGRTAQMVGMLETDGFIITDLLQRCFINFRHTQ